MSSPIACVTLSKSFHANAALADLDLEVPEGSIFALLGPNGAGKTTLIKILVNILKPTSGSATVLGTASKRLSPRLFTKIGYVSENQELAEWMTLNQFLAYLKPFYPTWDTQLAAELVNEFHLPGNTPLRNLSRGMKMKAALASSLAYRPLLLILDEPFSGLDPLARDEFIAGLLSRAEETTIFVSSHDVAEVESFASHVAFLQTGHLQFSEEIAALNARFRKVELIFDTQAHLPDEWPRAWSKPQLSGTTLRFVTARFDAAEANSQVRQLFGNAPAVSFTPMTLREIFLSSANEDGGLRR